MKAKQQETTIKEAINRQQEDFLGLDDLILSDEELDGIKGGSDGSGRTGGDWIVNHNETTTSDEAGEGEAQIADLPVADRESEEIKGGPYSVTRLNHNEIITSDSEVESEAQLADLPVADNESDDIKGLTGIAGGLAGGSTRLNHNETIALDKQAEDQLADLSVADEELDGIKGGSDGSGRTGGDWIGNHNEMIVTDKLN